MRGPDPRDGFRARGEEALGDLAQALLENPVFNQALATALGAGSRAAQAQRSALNALNIPSNAELERLGHRLRSLSDRVEALEDQLDEVVDAMATLRAQLARATAGAQTPVEAPAVAREDV